MSQESQEEEFTSLRVKFSTRDLLMSYKYDNKYKNVDEVILEWKRKAEAFDKIKKKK